MSERVQGYCPMGCGTTLFLGEGGHVTCSYLDCPDPCAADKVLGQRETEHIVVLGEDTFTVQHPLRERREEELFDCGLHRWIAALDGPPRQPGRYRVRDLATGDLPSRWHFERLSDCARPSAAGPSRDEPLREAKPDALNQPPPSSGGSA